MSGSSHSDVVESTSTEGGHPEISPGNSSSSLSQSKVPLHSMAGNGRSEYKAPASARAAAPNGDKVSQDDASSDESSGILEIWVEGRPSKVTATSRSESDIPTPSSSARENHPSLEKKHSVPTPSTTIVQSTRMCGSQGKQSPTSTGGPSPKKIPSVVPGACSRPVSQAPYWSAGSGSGSLSSQEQAVDANHIPKAFAPTIPSFTPFPPPQGSASLPPSGNHSTQPSQTPSQSFCRWAHSNNGVAPASLRQSSGSSSSAQPPLSSNIQVQPSQGDKTFLTPPTPFTASERGLQKSHTATQKHMPTEPRSPFAPLRYPTVASAATSSSRVPIDDSDDNDIRWSSQPHRVANSDAPAQGNKQASIPLSGYSNFFAARIQKRSPEHGKHVEEIYEWKLRGNNMENEVSMSMGKGEVASLVFERKAKVQERVNDKTTGRTTRSAAKAASAKRARATYVIDAEYDRRYLQYDDTPLGTMNILVRKTGLSYSGDDDFNAHLQKLPKPLPESESGSRIGRKYQARIPHLNSCQGDNTEDSLLPGHETIWDPVLAQAAERRGEDITGFLNRGRDRLVRLDFLLELLHMADYSVARASAAYDQVVSSGKLPSSDFGHEESAKLRRLLKSEGKDFARLSKLMGRTRSDCMVHYYRDIKGKSGSGGDYSMLKHEWKSNWCHVCDDGGELVICDGCSRAYHPGCLDPPLRQIPKDDWFCPRCTDSPVKPSEGHARRRYSPGLGLSHAPSSEGDHNGGKQSIAIGSPLVKRGLHSSLSSPSEHSAHTGRILNDEFLPPVPSLSPKVSRPVEAALTYQVQGPIAVNSSTSRIGNTTNSSYFE